MISIAEDDNSRSKFIYNFLKEERIVKTEYVSIPKVIMQFWHSKSELPKDVVECIESWKALKSNGFRFVFFDDETAKSFIIKHLDKEHLESYLKCHHPAMRCDYFRLCYLLICGGFYVDSDEMFLNQEIDFLFENNNIKIQPLCYSIQQEGMVDNKDFLSNPYDKMNIYYFNNNPIISPPNHLLIDIALKRATDRLLNDENIFDIQSTTGPGNLSAAVVNYLVNGQNEIEFIDDWNQISKSLWTLSYRNDDRNWRLYKGEDKKWFEKY
jgi:mannosyltransferase OCH1-like enzyme